jgi:hypothetical protein
MSFDRLTIAVRVSKLTALTSSLPIAVVISAYGVILPTNALMTFI